ncbi:MAG: FixH family protein [Pseudomonadota bacterium]
MTAQSFKLTGRHVLAIVLSFFLTVIAANTIFITLAVKSFPGEQEKKSYLQGLAYNDRIKARAEQNALGWTAEIARARLNNGEAEIDLYFTSASATPISTLKIEGVIGRPADDGDDHVLEFLAVEPGRYRAVLAGLTPGAWRLAATARSERGETFVLEKRLVLE